MGTPHRGALSFGAREKKREARGHTATPVRARGDVTHCLAWNSEASHLYSPRAGARDKLRTHRAVDAMFTRRQRHVECRVS